MKENIWVCAQEHEGYNSAVDCKVIRGHTIEKYSEPKL